LRDADRDLERLDAELSRRRKDVAAVERALAKAMGGELPSDPAAALEDRIRRLETLETAALSAAEEAADAKDSVATAERQRDVLGAAVAEERGRLDAIPGAVLIQRARELGVGPVPDAPRVPTAKDAARLAATAEVLATGLAALADALELRAADLAEGEGRLLSEAARMVEELPQPATSLAQLVEFVADLRRRAAAAAARAAQEAESQRRKLENARALAERISERRVHAQRFDALAKELRADHIIAFLQLEALQILAAAGSQHLSGLSDGRYRLAYEGDEFFVVDTWNGEEQRSARTLSGGETFLASLALALALSEQVRSLSLAERARLDSLFLDEGFGTLDPETLETVVEAIEQLGGDGRMVGVVTHVQELAIRLPTRIEVEKSPRGSRLQIVR
jgi:exonuclease SbcC